MPKVPRYWKINEANLGIAELGVMLMFAAVMMWLVPWLKKRNFHGWAIAAEIVAAIGLVVCLIRAFL